MGKLTGGKAFNARLPLALHRVIKADAKSSAKLHGGQTNMNKLIVELLFTFYRDRLTPEERAEVEAFIAKL